MANETQRPQYSDSYFLDTSTLIALHWEDPPVKIKTLTDLSNRQCHSSVYVRCQYKTRILNSMILVHTLVENSKTLEESRERAEKIRNSFDSLAYEVAMKLFVACETKEKLVTRLERHIEVDWRNYFHAKLEDDLCDLTGCVLGKKAPQRRGKFYVNIGNKCPDDCGVCEFWQKRATDLNTLASLNASEFTETNDPDGTISQIKAQADKVIQGESPRGEPCRKILDDATIAIEARDSYPGITVHSMDHDFELLSAPLGVPVRVLKRHRRPRSR